MWSIARQLDDVTIGGIARYYAVQPPAPGRSERPALAQARETAVTHDFMKGLTPEETQAMAAYVQSR